MKARHVVQPLEKGHRLKETKSQIRKTQNALEQRERRKDLVHSSRHTTAPTVHLDLLDLQFHPHRTSLIGNLVRANYRPDPLLV